MILARPRGGFTLIELLVVIAIISLLSSIVFAGVSQARIRERDSQRIQDLRQVQLALEVYKANNSRYPPSPFFVITSGLSCWDCSSVGQDASMFHDSTKLGIGGPTNSGISPYLQKRPSDPLTPNGGYVDVGAGGIQSYKGYWYKTDPNGEDYKIAIVGTIENPNHLPEKLKDVVFAPPDPELTPRTISLYSSDRSKLWYIGCGFNIPSGTPGGCP